MQLFNHDSHKRYRKLESIGEGGYGKVFKAFDEVTKTYVALKKSKLTPIDDGIGFVTLREVKFLKEFKHPNLIKLTDIYAHKKKIYLVFEYMETDLEEVIGDTDIILSASDIKAYMKMLLMGVKFLHENWILHRDLKPGNLLISNSGELKIGDFGAARTFGSPERKYTAQCVTRHYRAPELLYGADLYGPGVDMWSIGCIFAELMLRVPYFAGDNEFDQLGKIFSALGTPTEEKWPGMKSLPKYVEYDSSPETPFKVLFSAATDDCIDLLSKMLKFDPNDRISASDALNHKYFSSDPAPTPKHQLMLPTKRGPKKPLQFDYIQPSLDDHKRRRSPGSEEQVSVKRKLNLDSPI